jgi:outer membrane autotransporter protein
VNGYDFSKAEASEVALLDLPARIVIKGFDKLDSGDLVTGANYDMGDKTGVEVTGNYEFGEILNGAATKTMTVKEGGALAVQSAQALANNFVVEEGVLALGTTARTADARDALGKYNEKAGLYLSGTVDLASAKINVGNVAADVTTNVNLGSNGTLIVDATAAHEDAAATTVTGTINAVEGSTLHYMNVADQGIVTVDGKVKTTVDNLLFKVEEVADGQNKFTFERATGSDLAGTGLGGFDGDALVGMAENEVIGSLLDQANTAITSGSQREARLNGALNLAAAGGVQTAGIEAATMGIDQATKRAALTNVFLDGWTGFAEVTGTSLKMGGDSGALETKTELGGITVGGEYTMGDMTFGVMGNFGTGDVEGEGDNDGVKNDVDYYGVQGYAAKRMGQFNLVGQMGLMTTKNDVTSADGDSADIDATIFTIGARSEMAFQISKSCQAVPYVGLNYLRVATDGYNTAKGLSVDDMDQNLVSMPIGVAFSGNMDLASGWTLRPTVDVAYVHTFGDTDVEATRKFGAAAINTNLDVWSENVGRVGFGLEARKDALSFGGQIGGAFGDNDHREFYGQLNVKYLF